MYALLCSFKLIKIPKIPKSFKSEIAYKVNIATYPNSSIKGSCCNLLCNKLFMDLFHRKLSNTSLNGFKRGAMKITSNSMDNNDQNSYNGKIY